MAVSRWKLICHWIPAYAGSGTSNAPVIVITLRGDPGLTRVICQRVCDAPETICHSAFSSGWEICHYSHPGRKLGCLGYLEFCCSTFINRTFRFSSRVKYENLDHKKSEIFKHPCFRYSPIVKYENSTGCLKSEISKHSAHALLFQAAIL